MLNLKYGIFNNQSIIIEDTNGRTYNTYNAYTTCNTWDKDYSRNEFSNGNTADNEKFSIMQNELKINKYVKLKN